MSTASDAPAVDPAQCAETETHVADRTAAKRVFESEAAGVLALEGLLDAGFSRALDLIEGVLGENEPKGRVIVSGMGKSGHIARKIAATLASTGTPAYFVHPAEASHGDLGIIASADVVMALSNSGETRELGDLIGYTSRFGIPLIAITGKTPSTLADAASVSLVVPDMPEACPLGLAPTTSTTMMLALGDAIAVALLRRRGFTEGDFRVFHPGGKLGTRLMRVADLMHAGSDIPLVSPNLPMSEVLLVMTARQFGCAAVVDQDNSLLGVITDGDLRRHMGSDLLKAGAATVMSRDPKTIAPTILAAEALALMEQHKITALFVVASGKVLGILHIHDLLRAGVV